MNQSQFKFTSVSTPRTLRCVIISFFIIFHQLISLLILFHHQVKCNVSEGTLRDLFSAYGEVVDVSIKQLVSPTHSNNSMGSGDGKQNHKVCVGVELILSFVCCFCLFFAFILVMFVFQLTNVDLYYCVSY
jgi:hypothetical protein